MALLNDSREIFLRHDGSVVTGLDNRKGYLRVQTYQAGYPYAYRAITAVIEPMHKDTKHYRELRQKLGDDWVTDVLASPETECHVRMQLESHEENA